MSTKLKRFLSLMLVFVMVFSVMPTNAETVTTPTDIVVVDESAAVEDTSAEVTETPAEVTETPAEEPVVTETPAEEPVETEAPAEEPAVTEAPAEEPVVTEAPAEEPVETEAPAEEPVETEAPAEEPVVTEAPAEEPVETEAPAEAPVETESPTEEPAVTEEPVEGKVTAQTKTETAVATFGGESYTSLTAAFEAALVSGGTITLLGDVTELVRLDTDAITDPEAVKTVTLNLAGFRWNCGQGSRLNAMNLTITNGKIGTSGNGEVLYFGGHKTVPSTLTIAVAGYAFNAELRVNDTAPSDEELGMLFTVSRSDEKINVTKVTIQGGNFSAPVMVQTGAYLTIENGVNLRQGYVAEVDAVIEDKRVEGPESGATPEPMKTAGAVNSEHKRINSGVTVTFWDDTPVAVSADMFFAVIDAGELSYQVQKLNPETDVWEDATPESGTSKYTHTFTELGSVTYRIDWLNNGTYDLLVVLEKTPIKVGTKAELKDAIANASAGATILLTADIDYGTDQLAIDKPIILDLGGFTLTTRNAYGGMSLKNNPTVKNGTIVHASNTAAIKAWNVESFEDLIIDVQGKGDANKTIGGIVVQSGTDVCVRAIKNVTIKGDALTNGIETYECGNATEPVIGSMENVTIDARGTGMLISAPCGTATNCSISGDVTGIEIWIKGTYSASLDLVNSTVHGGTQAVKAHDEFSNADIVNNGTLVMTADDATTFTSDSGKRLTLTIARITDEQWELPKALFPVAKVNDTEYYTMDEAVAAWTNGTTLTLLADVTLSDVIKLSSTEYHILDLGIYTMTAAKSKDAFQIVNNGRSSASYALDIKADAENPGGITATGKAIVRTAGKSGIKDRPIIRFHNGVFTASYIAYHSGSNGTNCPQFYFYDGEYNGTIFTNRTLNQFYGGTFNGSLMMSVDSSAYTRIEGGTFKQLSNLYMSALNSDKFTIGSAKGVFDKGIYVDVDGYYVVGGTPITTDDAEGTFALSTTYHSQFGTNGYLTYSSAAANGLFYKENTTVDLVKVITDTANQSSDQTLSLYQDFDLTGEITVNNNLTVNLNNYQIGEPTFVLTKDGMVMTSDTKLELENVTTTVADRMVAVAEVEVDGKTVYTYTVAQAVAQIGETMYATLDEAFEAAVAGDEVEILVAGTYALNTSGKDITITGAVDGVVFDDIGAKNMGGANVTFNNVTFDYYPNGNYTGLQHSGNLVYNNCTFEGQVFLYGTSETFNNCTFNQNSADAYNVWTYSAGNVEFSGCTFNSVGKSVLLYSESADAQTNLNVVDCDFIATSAVEGKAAIEIDTNLMKNTVSKVTIDAATTATGFDAGSVSGESLWNDKKNQTNIEVWVDGVQVWPNFVASITDAEGTTVKYTTLTEAVAAANAIEGGATVTLLTDVTLGEKLTISGNVTIEGEYTITRDDAYTGTLFAVSAGAALTLDGGLTIDGGNEYTFDSAAYNADLAAFTRVSDGTKYFTPEEGAPVATAHMMTVSGTLNLNDVTIKNHYATGEKVLVSAGTGAHVNLTGATITHNAITSGSGLVVNASTGKWDKTPAIWVTMNGGTTIDGNHVGGNHGVFKVYMGTVFTMNGGSIKNTTGWNSNGVAVGVYWATFNMNGGEICSNSSVYGPNNGRNAPVYLHSAHIFTMTDGSICHNVGGSRSGLDAPYADSSSNGIATITGGYIGDNSSYYNDNGMEGYDADVTAGDKLTITGGTYTQDVTQWLAPNYGLVTEVREDGVTEYTVTDKIAQVVSTGEVYHSIAEAIAAADAGDTVKVLVSHKIGETVEVKKAVTLDLNGMSVSSTGDVFEVVSGGTLTITGDGEVKGGTSGVGSWTAVWANGGNVIINGGTYSVGGDSSAADQNHQNDVIYTKNSGTVTINGGEFLNDGTVWTLNENDSNRNTITVYGGTFHNWNPADNVSEGVGTDFVAEGYISVANEDETIWTVRKANYIAQVGDVKYESLQEAINACPAGQTVQLIANVIYTSDDVVYAHGGGTGFGKYDASNPSIIYTGGTRVDGVNSPSTVNAVLDLNGYTITNNADAYMFMIMDNAKLTFKDSVGTGSITNTAAAPVIWAVGTETLVKIANGKYVTANDEGLLWSTHGADMVIDGGNFSTTADDASLLIVRNEKDLNNAAYFVDGNATITIYGGTYNYNPEKTYDDSTKPYTEFNAVADGYIARQTGENTWVVGAGEWAAQVGETKYETFKDALEVAQANETDKTVILLKPVEISEDTTYDLSGVTVTSEGDAFIVTGGTLTLNGNGVVKAGTSGVGSWTAVWANGGNVIINGGTYSVGGDSSAADQNHQNDVIYTKNSGTVTINGGEFLNDGTVWTLNENDSNRNTITVYGGTFHNWNPADNVSEGVGTNFVAEGYISETTDEGVTYTVREFKPVAQIGETQYESVQEAIDAAQAGETVELIADVTITESINVAADDQITLDLNGHTLQTDATVNDTTSVHVIVNAGDLTITDSEGNGAVIANDCATADNGSKTKNGFAVSSTSGSSLAINGAKIVGTNWGYALYVVDAGTTVTLNDAVVEGRGALYLDGGATGTVNGGSYTMTVQTTNNQDNVVYVGGASELTINDGTFTTGNITGAQRIAIAALGTSKVTINDGSFYGATDDLVTDGSATISVTNGTFTGIQLREKKTTSTISLTGGTYSYDPAEWVAEGYKEVDNGDGTWTVVEDGLFDIYAANVRAGDSLDMFFYVQKSDLDGEEYYAEIVRTFSDGSADDVVQIPYSSWESYNDELFRFGYDDIAAKEMADELYVTVYNSDGTEASNLWTDSVSLYATRMLNNGSTGELRTALVDMLNYGAAAQEFFDYNTSDLANAEIGDYQQYATPSVSYADYRVKGDNYAGSTVSAKNRLMLTFYFSNITTDMTANISYTDHYGNEKTVTVSGSGFYKRGSLYGVDVVGLAIADGRQLVTCEVVDTDGTVVASATDSVESYVARQANLDPVFELLMKFVESAYNYFH